jgi:hypothetical protein
MGPLLLRRIGSISLPLPPPTFFTTHVRFDSIQCFKHQASFFVFKSLYTVQYTLVLSTVDRLFFRRRVRLLYEALFNFLFDARISTTDNQSLAPSHPSQSPQSP